MWMFHMQKQKMQRAEQSERLDPEKARESEQRISYIALTISSTA